MSEKNTTDRGHLRLVKAAQPKKPTTNHRPIVQKCGRFFEELLALGRQLQKGGAK